MVLIIHSKYHFQNSRGDKIATIICEKVYFPKLNLVEKLDDTTRRGARGFGSTVPHYSSKT